MPQYQLTSHFFCNAQKLVPRRLVPIAEQSFVPFWKAKCRNDKLSHVLGVCERQGIVACTGYSRCFIGHVNTKRNRRHVALDVGDAEIIQEIAIVNSCPFEIRLLQLGHHINTELMLWQL